MRAARLGTFFALGALCFLFVGCVPQAPTKVTLEYDAALYAVEFDADGDPVMRQVAKVPKGAVCTYVNASASAGEAWVAVEKCTLNGQDYGDGRIGVEVCKERETLYAIINSR